MRRTFFALLFLFAMPLAAFDRGDVYFEHRSSLPGNSRVFFEPWVFDPQWDYAAGPMVAGPRLRPSALPPRSAT